MCSQMQNVANTIFQQFFPTFLANEGLNCLFFFFAMNIVLAAFVFFFIPETKKVSLEEMDVLFGGVNHVEKGAQVLGIREHDKRPPKEVKDNAEVQQSETRREVV
jgi:mannose/fructose/N-acetylgalactosamine-specific phosphotransferase system component IID